MFFCNLLGEKGMGSIKRSTNKGLVYFINDFDGVQNAGVYKVGDTLKVCLESEVTEDMESVLGTDLDGELGELFQPNLSKLTFQDVKDTDENKLIWVLAEKVVFYENVKTYVKYININSDMVLVCLVYGACGFHVNGKETVLTRCIESGPSERARKIECKGSDLKERLYCKDKDTDYDMSYDMTLAMLVNCKSSKGEFYQNYKKIKQGTVVLSSEGLEVAKKRHEAILQKREEEEAKKRERRRAAEEADRERRKREEEEASMFATAPKKPSKKNTGGKTTTVVGSKGARAFMQAVQDLM